MAETVKGKYATKKGFFVQVGKGNGAYLPKYSFEEWDRNKAYFYYESVNIGYGHKKRLIHNGKVIRKAFS